MKRTWDIFKFLMAAMLAAGMLFFGCSSESSDGENENEQEDTSAAELSAALENVVGTYFNEKKSIVGFDTKEVDRSVVRISKLTEGTFTIRSYTIIFWNESESNEHSQLQSDDTDTFTAIPFSKLRDGANYKNTNYKASNTKHYDYSFGNEYYIDNGTTKRTSKESMHYNLRNNGDGTINLGFSTVKPDKSDSSDIFDDENNVYKKISDDGFNFETGKLVGSSSGGDGDTGSLPSDFDITASTWTYTGTAGKTTITYTVSFNSDGSLAVAKSEKSQATGTWSLDGSTLKVTAKNTSGTEATDSFSLTGDSSSLTLTLSGKSSYTTNGSTSTTSDYSMALTVMFMASSKTATLTAQ